LIEKLIHFVKSILSEEMSRNLRFSLIGIFLWDLLPIYALLPG